MHVGRILRLVSAAVLLCPTGCDGSPDASGAQGGGGSAETSAGGALPSSAESSGVGSGGGGGDEQGPPCEPIVGVLATTGASRSIAINAKHVFWTDAEKGTVTRMPRCGGPAIEIYAGSAPAHLVIHGENLYWAELDAVYGKNTIVRRPAADLSGGVIVAKTPTSPNGLVVDDEAVYFANDWLRKVPHGAQAPLALTPKPVGSGGFNIASDDDYVYAFTAKGIERVSKQGGDPELIVADAELFAWCIAVDETHVYWTTYANDTGVLHRAPKSGGDPEPLHQTKAQRCLALDETHVFWTGDGIFSADKQSFEPTQFSEVPGVYVAMDERTVYWTTGDTVRAQAR